MYKKGGEFSSLFDHLSSNAKDWYAHNAYDKNAKTDWSFSDENIADMKNEANSLVDKVAKGELDNEEAANDLYAIYALLTNANFHDDAREIAKLAHDFYADDALGDWDDEYVSDEQLAAHEEQMKKNLGTPDDFPRSKKNGFDFHGSWIDNPQYDETGRFPFNSMNESISHYGNENADAIKRMYKELGISEGNTESSDKPHDEDVLLNGEESELEKKMTPEEFKIISNLTGRSTGDFKPETPEDVKLMIEANKNGLKISDKRLKNVQNNSINRIANTLKNYRW